MRKDLEIVLKVLELTDVHTFRCSGPVYNEDGTPLRTAPGLDTLGIPKRIYTVCDESIGFASFYTVREDTVHSQCIADMFLVRDCPERFDMEQGVKHFLVYKDSGYELLSFPPSRDAIPVTVGHDPHE